jgi:hypothetical protein
MLTTEKLDLMTAKVEAAAASKKEGKKVFIVVDAEGDCSLSFEAEKGAIHSYRGGSEVPLTQDDDKTVSKKTKESASKTTAKKSSDSKTKSNEVMETKTKKSAKKSAPKKAAKAVKKAAAPKVKKEVVPFKGTSLAAVVKEFVKSGEKKGTLVVNGKTFAINSSGSWAVRRTSIEAGKDGIIMYFPSEKGFFLYPRKDFNDLFGAIFKSSTYKNIGIYSQSSMPKGHEESYWNELK